MAVRTVLLLGGLGQLGCAIRKSWPAEIVAPPRAELDIEDAGAVCAALDRKRYDAVVNCAAFHNVERCETEPERAFSANALAVNALAQACPERAVTLVTFSTDYVFDGQTSRPYREDETPLPVNVYGASKLAGEVLVRRLQSPAYVVRTCGVYGTRESTGKGHTFVERIFAQKRAGETVRVVSDQTVSPTFAGDLAAAVWMILERELPFGVYHAVNEEPVTWYDYAREALRLAQLDDSIEPVSYRSWDSRVRRPAYSALENARLHQAGITLPHWRDALRRYVTGANPAE